MKRYELTVYMYIVIFFLVLHCVLQHIIAVMLYMNYIMYMY